MRLAIGAGISQIRSVDTLRFGTVTIDTSKILTVGLWNNGPAPVHLSRVSSSNPGFTVAFTDSTIGPGMIIPLTLTFSPKDSRRYRDSIQIVTDDSLTTRCSIFVFGLGSIVRSISPAANATDAFDSCSIRIAFVRPLNETQDLESAISITGSLSGRYEGTIRYDRSLHELTFTPNKKFRAGEGLTVAVRRGLAFVTGDTLGAYQWNFTAAPRAGSGKFSPGNSTGLPEGMNADMKAADLNGDGIVDLASIGNNTLSVAKNLGGLSFSKQTITLNVSPTDFCTADLDVDGMSEIAVASTSDKAVAIYKCGPDGIIKLAARIVLVSAPSAITCSDIDGDGRPDLIMECFYPINGIIILKNTGGLTFATGAQIPFKNGNLSMSALCDLDGDGDMDLVAPSGGAHGIYLYEHIRDFEFEAPKFVPISGEPWKVICADFDNNGAADLAVLNNYTHAVSVYRNNGMMEFSAPYSSYPVGYSSFFTAADLDHDGAMDLAIADYSSTYYILLKNNGDGTFVLSKAKSTDEQYFGGVTAADFDDDGDIDLASIYTSKYRLLIAENKNAAPRIRLTATSCDFGTIKRGTSQAATFKIYNDGASEPLTIMRMSSSSPDISISTPTTVEIGAGDTLAVVVNFTPTVSRTYLDSITIFSSDAQRPSVSFLVKGICDDIIAIDPVPYSCAASETTAIRIALGVKLDASTLNDSSVIVRGAHTGIHAMLSSSYDRDANVLTLRPVRPFRRGEQVNVSLTSRIRTENNERPFRPKSWAFTIRTTASSQIFRVRSTTPVAIGPVAIALRDLNNDSLLDLIVLGNNGGLLTFFRNDGNLAFTFMQTLKVGFGPKEIAAEDLDNDGDIDIIVPDLTSSVLFLRNDGAFNFTPTSLATPGYLECITAGDYDGDGWIDLATATNGSGGEFDLIRNNGQFSFTVTPTMYGGSRLLYSTDFNGDGATDIACIRYSTVILKNDGSSNFSNSSAITSSTNPTTYGDFNRDGLIDLAGCYWGYEPSYGIMVNKGDGVFQELSKKCSRTSVTSVLASDLNADSLSDLLIMCDSGLVSAQNLGNANFIEKSILLTPAKPFRMAIGDLDNDGDDDAVVLSLLPNVMMIVEQRNPFNELALSAPGCNFSAVSVGQSRSVPFQIKNLGDLPLRIDSLSVSSPAFEVTPRSGIVGPNSTLEVTVTFTPAKARVYSDSVTIFSNDTLHARTYFYVSGRAVQSIIDSVYPARNAIAGDPASIAMRFSSAMDPATLTPSAFTLIGSKSGIHQGQVSYDDARRLLQITPGRRFIDGEMATVTIHDSVRMADGTRILLPVSWSFFVRVREGSAAFENMNKLTTDVGPEYLCSADLDADGIEDLVVSNHAANTVSVFKSKRNAAPAPAGTISVGTYPMDVVAGDFDRDGAVDIIVSAYPSFFVLRNTGNFTFAKSSFTTGLPLSHIAACDLDGDGDLDLAAADQSNKHMQVLRNDGGMHFTVVDIPGLVEEPSALATRDFDADGLADILVGKGSGNNLTLLHNEGRMVFLPVKLPNVSGYVVRMVVSDFNGDGTPDIYCPSPNSNSASVLFNRGELLFENVRQDNVGYDALSLCGADFDNDGDMDVAAVNNGYSNSGSVYLNMNSVFRQTTQFLIEPGSHNSITGDLNGDGAMDIAYVNQNSRSVSVLFNIRTKKYTLSSQTLPFGGVALGKSLVKKVVMQNTGTMPLRIDSLYARSPRFVAAVNTTSLACGDSATITVTFTPDSLGTFNDTLTIASDATVGAEIALSGSCSGIAAVDGLAQAQIPADFVLFQNYPNPFNPVTTIRFGLPEESDVTVKVYDLLGRELETLVSDRLSAGYHNIAFNGERLASGVYLYRLTASCARNIGKRSFTDVRTLVLIR